MAVYPPNQRSRVHHASLLRTRLTSSASSHASAVTTDPNLEQCLVSIVTESCHFRRHSDSLYQLSLPGRLLIGAGNHRLGKNHGGPKKPLEMQTINRQMNFSKT